MKKLFLFCILLCVVIIAALSLAIGNKLGTADEQKENNYPYVEQATLVVNGKTIPFDGVLFYRIGNEECVSVPFLRFLDAVGYHFDQIDKENVMVGINGKDYIFSKATGSLYERGNNINLFIPYNGHDSYSIRIREQDVYLDVKVISETMNSLGENMTVDVSCEDKTIIVAVNSMCENGEG